MSLKQWDIVKVRINSQDRDEHYAIVLSPTEVAGDPRYGRVNVIYGSTKRPAEELRPGHFLLDEADGLERVTKFDCLFFPVVSKASISSVAGSVSPLRRRPLCQTISATLRFFQ